MKDYFAVLEVPHDATVVEIKKAYFKLIRKYHPDKHPDEFIAIREAYEALSNEDTRKEYTEFSKLDTAIKLNFKYVKDKMESGDYYTAIKMLKELLKVDPDSLSLTSYLGQAYLKNENIGKAIEVFERLVKIAPGHAGFAGELAKAYMARGWHKKAISAFDIALELDDDNLSLWLGLFDAYMDSRDFYSAEETMEKALVIGKSKDWDQMSIHTKLIDVSMLLCDYEKIKDYVQPIIRQAMDDDSKKEVSAILMEIGAELLHRSEPLLASEIFAYVEQLAPDKKEIKKMIEAVTKLVSVEDELKRFFADLKIHDTIKHLIHCDVVPMDTMQVPEKYQDSYKEIIAAEIAEDYNECRESIEYVERVYPKIYDLKSEFFIQLQDKNKRNQIIKRSRKNSTQMMELMSHMMHDGMEEDFEETYQDEWIHDHEAFHNDFFGRQEPYVREQPKTGRNDPCPCGSGKKYKRCCGA